MRARLTLPVLAAATVVLFALSIAMVFFYVPVDQDGFNRKIFYFHVPIALTAYACFAVGAWKALVHLWKRDPRADLQSYVAIHQGVIFGVLVLLTGSIWAKYRWGHWWLWSSNQLVLFLVLFLFYAAYFMLRFSVEDGPQLGGSQLLTFCVCFVAMLTLAGCLYAVEITGKRLDARLRELRELLREPDQANAAPRTIAEPVTR